MAVTGLPVLRMDPQLSIGDAETLATWFLHHADPDTRGALMADQPLVYARVYPGVNPEAILRKVRDGLARVRQDHAAAFVAKADELVTHAGHYHDPSGKYDWCADPRCPRAARTDGSADGSDPVADGLANLRSVLEAARELTEPGEVNTEYVRGQASLIAGLFALVSGEDPSTEQANGIITDAIAHLTTIDAALSELAALTGAETA